MKSKTIIVTGGASGIGKSVCIRYAELGWCVIFLDIDTLAGESLRKELCKVTTAYFYECDFSVLSSVKSASNLIKNNHPSINLIIHMARGPYESKNISENISFEMERDFNIFIRSPLYMCEKILENLKLGGSSSIIFIGSTNSNFISHQPLSYHVFKGALLQLVKFLAVSWGGSDIRVNLVNPGVVEVPGRLRNNADIFSEVVKSVIPLERVASSTEVADVCLFLSSSQASYITGTSIDLDGGEHLKDHFSLAYKIIESKETLK